MNWLKTAVGLLPVRTVSVLAGAFLTSCVQIPPQDVIGGQVPTQTQIVGGSCDVTPVEIEVTDRQRYGDRYLAFGQPLRLITWNIHKQKDAGWRADFSRLGRDRDLFVLQEAFFDEQLTATLTEMKQGWSMATAWRNGTSTTGVLTVARSASDYQCTLRAMEPITGVPKSILISRFPIAGSNQSLLVANVHGVNFSLGMASYRRQFEALERVLQQHQGPLILAGDFNTWRKARMQVIGDMAKRLSLDQVDYLSHNRIRVFGNPLDHIYYRGLDIVHYSSPSVASSDHNPLLVTFRLRAQTQGWL